MSEKNRDQSEAENDDSEDFVMKLDDDDEISEEQMNELIELTKGIVNIAAVMNKFTNIMGGLKEMVGNLTEKVSMLEEEISDFSPKENESITFEIDENDNVNKNREEKEEIDRNDADD